jgi:hypothetical protein
MNTTSLPILSFVAAVAASIVLPLSAPVACIALTVTGVAAMLASDYGRDSPPIQARADVIAVDFADRDARGAEKAA